MLDDIGKLGDLYRPVVKQCLPFGYCTPRRALSELLQHRWFRALHHELCLVRCGAPCKGDIHSANLPNFSIVPVMPLPISAAFLANSDLAPFLRPWISPFGDPLTAFRCDSARTDCRGGPIFDEDCRFCACAKTARNSAVRSWIEVVPIISGSMISRNRCIVQMRKRLCDWV